MADTNDTTSPGQWKAGAKALASFQKQTYAAGKTGSAQGRKFSSLKDITKSIQTATEFGLSHSETWRNLDGTHALLRVTLHHESGEAIWSELPVDVTQKNRSGSREQAQGSAMTYARRYLLLGIYGLANDDEDDDGEATTDAPAAAAKPAPAPKPAPKAAPASAPETTIKDLTAEEKAKCLELLKDPTNGPTFKTKFMTQFYPSAEKLFPNMITSQEHLEFLLTLALA